MLPALWMAACSGPAEPPQQASSNLNRVTGERCVSLDPPKPGQLEGLAPYSGGAGEAVVRSIEDLDGDGQQDLLISGKNYTSATGNMAAALYLKRAGCGRYLGSVWAGSGTSVRIATGRHAGLPVLRVSTRMTFKEFETRYCFDGTAYATMAERVRHFYDHQRGKLRHLLLDSHWESWKASRDRACQPISTGAARPATDTAPWKLGQATGGRVLQSGTSAPGKPASANKVSTPAVGSALRRTILDTLRVPVESDLDQKVKFRISRRGLKLAADWALVVATPLLQNGKPMDYSRSRYQADINDGTFDDGIIALLHRERGGWAVVVYEVGCTDLCWEGWDKKHGAPARLFKD